MRSAENITQLIGNTQAEGCVARIVVKLESMSPSSSVKDRMF